MEPSSQFITHLNTIYIILGIIGFVFTFLLGLIGLGNNARLERYYSRAVDRNIKDDEYLLTPLVEVPRKVIVDSGRPLSPIRTFLKRTWIRIRRGNPVPVVYIFANLSEYERKAFVLQKAFSAAMNIQLLDLEFIEDLINYHTYKYCESLEEIEMEVKNIIRKKFESSKNREKLLKLDSLDFENYITLNPPPENKPLISNVIIPIVREQQKTLNVQGDNLLEREKWKAFFMDIIERICQKTCGIIFVGIRAPGEYIHWVENNGDALNLFIFAARGFYIKRMVKIYDSAREIIAKKWGTSLEEVTIKGIWRLEELREIDSMWIIAKKV